ncbi:hypothetical protein HMPREF1563_1571 [Providencia alcalifaciens 205/92]|uniref:Uncharacterized protein n=1 Tax=Providencia alcalifaciens 205/92 TaxID=1256988 RepID=A0AAV3M8M1_9GAMM|nr:hypothetical protein HMPREF1563_1571 [Providencia alcalifaciens 205/92]
MELNKREQEIVIELLEQLFRDGFGDEEECALYEKLKDAEASNAGN